MSILFEEYDPFSKYSRCTWVSFCSGLSLRSKLVFGKTRDEVSKDEADGEGTRTGQGRTVRPYSCRQTNKVQRPKL